MITAMLMLYAAGFGFIFVVHLFFDGGVVYPTRKEGPIVGLIAAAFWPVIIIAMLVAGVVTLIKNGG